VRSGANGHAQEKVAARPRKEITHNGREAAAA
jgi:hypothetical protein